MTQLQLLSAKLDAIIEFKDHAHIDRGSGRINNPLYDPEAKPGMRNLDGKGVVVSVPLSKVMSTQRTVHYSRVRKLATKIGKGQLDRPVSAVAQAGKYVLTDGNHHAAGHVRAGKRMIKLLLQG